MKIAQQLLKIRRYITSHFKKNNILIIQSRLAQTPLFCHLEETELKYLATYFNDVHYREGDLILKKEEPVQKLFIVESGLIETHADLEKSTSSNLKPNDYFGEMILIRNKISHSHKQYKALTDVRLFEISRKSLNDLCLLNNNFNVILNFIRKKEIIRKISLKAFKKSNTRFLKSILSGEILNFKKNDSIFNEGEEANNVYYIINGKINLLLNNQNSLNFELKKNQIFGEQGVIHNQPRSGAAIVSSETAQILAIPKEKFLHLHQTDKKFRRLISAIKRIYKISQSGTVILQRKVLFGSPVINTITKLNQKIIMQSTQVIDKNIFYMHAKNFDLSEKIHFENKTVMRELSIFNKKITGIISIGLWDELESVCQLALNQSSVTPWQLRLFTQTGDLDIKNKNQSNEDTLCYCLQIKRQEINTLIQNGTRTIHDLMTATGIGSVCGCCRPDVLTMLGKNAWSMVEATEIKEIATDTFCYRFKPVDGNLFSYHAGQHIVLSCLINGNWTERSYTLTSVSDTDHYYEIIINHIKDGYVSKWLSSKNIQEIIARLSIPQGQFILNEKEKSSTVFFAAGIGITPALAFLRNLLKKNLDINYFHLHYSVKSKDKLIHLDELIRLKDKNNRFSFDLLFTKEQGHISEEKIQEIAKKFPQADFYICGPKSYQIDLSLILHHCGIASAQIKIEDFTSVKRINE